MSPPPTVVQVAWRINKEVLDTVVTCLEDKIAVGDLPTADDLPVPDPPDGVLVTEKGGFSIPKKEHFESEEAHKKAIKTLLEHRRMVNKVGMLRNVSSADDNLKGVV